MNSYDQIFNWLFLEHALVGAGVTFLVTFSSLFKFLREKAPVLKCPLCVGFWVGVIGSLLNFYFIFGGIKFSFEAAAFLFKAGIVTSIFSYILYCILYRIE